MVMVNADNDLVITKLKYTLNGYEQNIICLTPEMQETNALKLRQQIIGDENPKKIILYSTGHGSMLFKLLRNTILKSKNLIAVEKTHTEILGKAAIEIAKWLKDKSRIRFHLIPVCSKTFIFTDKFDNFENPLLTINRGEQLPLTKEYSTDGTKNIYVVS
uniref:Uncharacterized protein n=1 Tax=Panagrolaimus davidi TaxID=227884 RepID=A0A914Q792_9BILA